MNSMKVTRMMRLAWGALKNRKLRAVLTILGITIGPAVIVALVGATQGYGAVVTSRFNSLGATTIFVMGGGPRSGTFHLNNMVVRVISQIPNVTAVVPYYSIQGTTTGTSTATSISIIATDVSKLTSVMPGLSVAEGSLPTSPSQAVIGNTIANPTDGSQPVYLNAVISTSINRRSGTRVQTITRAFVADGILQPFGQSFFLNPDTTVFVPLAEGQSITGSSDYSGLYVIASSTSSVTSVQSAISDYYGNKVRVMAVSSILSTIQSISSGTDTILISVAFMSVIVAFIGIMTTMFTSVAERTREIGILKSLGFAPRDILGMFLSESVLTGAIGGFVGICLGTALSYIVVGMFGGTALGIGFGGPPGARSASTLVITPIITSVLLVETFILAVGIGAIAGLLPSWRASKMIPVVALRHE